MEVWVPEAQHLKINNYFCVCMCMNVSWHMHGVQRTTCWDQLIFQPCELWGYQTWWQGSLLGYLVSHSSGIENCLEGVTYILLVVCTDGRGPLLTRNDRWFLRGCWKKLVESVASGRCGFRKRRVLYDGRQEWITGIPRVRTAYKFSSCSTSFMKIYISPHNPYHQQREPRVSTWEFATDLLFYMTPTFLHDLRLPVPSTLISLDLQHFTNLPFLP